MVYAIKEYNPSSYAVRSLQATSKKANLCKTLKLNDDDEKSLIEIIDQLKNENIPINYINEVRGYQKGEPPIGPGQKIHTCGSFESLLSISPDGRIVSCLKGSAHEEF